MFMAQFKDGKYSHYVTRQFCFGWKCFCFRCYKMYFSKLIHCRSGHCWPFQISNQFQSFYTFSSFFDCVHCLTFKGKVITSQCSLKWNEVCRIRNLIAYCKFVLSRDASRWVRGIKRLKL